MVSKRDFGSIKSILHFDFPYFNEPYDGLTDEVGNVFWTGYKFSPAGTQIPYAINAAPKFGYRCAYFDGNAIYGRDDTCKNIFSISPQVNCEFEAFVKLKKYQSGNILTLEPPYEFEFWDFNGHTFALMSVGDGLTITWNEAEAYCESLGGHLATVTSAEKANLLNEMNNYPCWLGATYDNQAGTWKWITGEEWNYTEWKNSESASNPGDMIYLLHNYDYDYNDDGWCPSDEFGNGCRCFICEWDEEIGYIDNLPMLSLSVKDDGILTLKLFHDIKDDIADFEVTSSIALTLNTWQHVLLRFSEGYCTLYLDGVQVLGAEITKDINVVDNVILGGYCGYMDEFVFRNSAGSGTPKIPAAPYNATFDVGLVGGFGTGSDGDVTISADSQINSYGRINSITDAKIFAVNSWNNGMYNGYSYFNGHAFKYFSNTMTWQEAKTYCEMLGGHLATSISEEKNNFLVSLTGNKNIWVGGTDENSEGNWEWVTGEEWDYSNWYSGQPDNASNNQHYLMLNYSSKQWYDYKNTSTYGFVCEWDYEIDMSGRELMLHITAPTSTTSGYYPNVGLYAFSKIASIDGNNVVLEDDITTENGFDFTLDSDLLSTYYVQAITVPHFKTLTINSGATVTPLSWNTTTGGGIVAFRCKGDCTIRGNITTHGRGAVRYDYVQMENSKLIDRFLCAQGGGIFITCGGTFSTTENARLGATWSGEGDGSNGAAGKGGNSGAISNNKISPNLGGVGGGGGGSACYNNGNVSIGGSVGSSAPATSYMGAGGGGCGGNGSSTTYPSAPGGSGGGGQCNSGGKAGTGGTNGSSGEKGTINGGNTVIGSGTSYPAYLSGAGGGGPGGNGGSGYRSKNTNNYGTASRGIAGASLVLLCKILNATIASISTGGSSGEIVYYNDAVHMGAPGGGGTGFCYISAERLK